MSPAFSVDSTKSNEPRIIDIIERFCDTIAETADDGRSQDGWGKRWNASEMATYLGFDIMGALVFGSDFRSVQAEENRKLARSVLPATKLLYWASQSAFTDKQ